MEYLSAGNLKTILLDEDIVLGPLIRTRFGAEIANGLAFIHNLFDDKRLLHGDIKPENILMTEDLHCKIEDFGAAELCSFTGSSTLSKRRSSLQMTLFYAAPERLRDISTKLTTKCDTYSVGITYHMILARELPLTIGTSVTTFIEAIVNGQRPSLESILEYERSLEAGNNDAGIIRFFKEEMIGCWQQDPADRPTMTEVKERLYDKLANRNVSVIENQVGEALGEMKLRKSSYNKDDCLPAYYGLPPSFDFNATLLPQQESTCCSLDYPDPSSPYKSEIACRQEEFQGKKREEHEDSEPSEILSSAQAQIQGCLETLHKNDFLKGMEDDSLLTLAKFDIMQIHSYVSSKHTQEFRTEVIKVVLHNDAIPLFLQYFKVLVNDGNKYPKNRLSEDLLLRLEYLILSMTDVSSIFCVSCGKQGLLSLLVTHLRKLNSLSLVPVQWQEMAEIATISILLNCARFQNSSKYVSEIDTFSVVMTYQKEMAEEPKINRIELLTLSAFLLAYVAGEDHIGEVKVHTTLIHTIIWHLTEGLKQSNRLIKFHDGYCLTWELCDGLAQLAYNSDNAAAIFKIQDSVDCILSTLKSDTEINRRAGLHLIYNLSKNCKKKVTKHTKLINYLETMRVQDPIVDMRILADKVLQQINSTTSSGIWAIMKLRK
ncbi:unnamed protein product [Clavelina lepadiformis]